MDRRVFMQATASAATSAAFSGSARAALPLLTRTIPSSGEKLPVVGFGNSQSFRDGDYENSKKLLDVLTDTGGRFIDTSGTDQEVLGRYMAENPAHNDLFLATNMRTDSAKKDLAYLQSSLAVQGREVLDLVQLQRPDEFDKQWRRMQGWKDKGLTRHIGIAVSGERYFPMIEKLLKSMTADFVQMNYSMIEPESGERLLPMARDNGVAVVTNRPFINGQYFSLVRGQELPDWTVEFDCESWAQFSIKYILANPAVNCVLTETTKPHHALDNLSAGIGRLPDDKTRVRMIELMRSF